MSPIRFGRVRPGDLITAEFVNRVLDEIEQLQDQVDGLTGGQPDAPIISAMIPGGDVAAGSELQILGRNFATPAYLNTVTLDQLPLTAFLAGSSDTLLRMAVPANLPGLPKTMTLTVATTKGTVHVSVRIVPSAPGVGGKPSITNATSGQPVIQVGQTYTLTFQLSGEQLENPEQFQLAARYDNADPAGTENQWQTATTLGGTDQAQTITLAPGGQRMVTARVTVPATANLVDLSLVATSVHNSPTSDGKSLPLRLEVGQPAPNNDAGVGMKFGQIGPLAPLRIADIDGVRGLVVRYGTNPVVPIEATLPDDKPYAFTVAVRDAGTLWTTTQPSGPITGSAGAQVTVGFNLQLNVAGPANEKRLLTVTATRQDPGGAGPTSSITFPIAGFS